MAAGACVQLLAISFVAAGQTVNPRGVPPTPVTAPERESERDRPRNRRVEEDFPRPQPRSAKEVKQDFLLIQTLNETLPSLGNSEPLDYARIAATASKIKSIAGRLDSSLLLPEMSKQKSLVTFNSTPDGLRTALTSLHDLIGSFAGNPVFNEPGVIDVEQTTKARQDMKQIIAVSAVLKKIAKTLGKN